MRSHGSAKGNWRMLFSPSKSLVRKLVSVAQRAAATPIDQSAPTAALSRSTFGWRNKPLNDRILEAPLEVAVGVVRDETSLRRPPEGKEHKDLGLPGEGGSRILCLRTTAG